jgi:4a-hydroxytetrahydrobiopterin dehydratase
LTPLTNAELQQFLKAHPGWSSDGKTLEKTYEFASFPEAIAFVGRVAEVAERQDHHPDIDIRYRKVKLSLTTHEASGLTFRDPLLASEVEKVR